MEAKLAPSANLLALPVGTELVGDYRIKRVLGAGGFGITYLADETALGRLVTIKEYFPAEFAARRDSSAMPRSRSVADDYQWGLDRFIEEAQTLARFDHPNIVRVHRYFRANNTGYMVLHFEEGGSFKAWLKGLKRAPRQTELDKMLAPLLDALEIIHRANFLHRDIAPDNIMVRKDGSPVLIDFGSARGAIAAHSRTVSALVKPGYSPYEQYATNAVKQGPWTDIYALGATLYHAITGRRPPDAPSRVVNDEYVPAREAALSVYRGSFLDAVDRSLRIEMSERPQRIAEWRSSLLALDGAGRKPGGARSRVPLARTLSRVRAGSDVSADLDVLDDPASAVVVPAATVPASLVPAPPDAPQRQGQLLDFIEALKKHRPAALAPRPKTAAPPTSKRPPVARSIRAAPLPAASLPAEVSPEPQGGAVRTRQSRQRRTPTTQLGRWRVRVVRWGSALFRVAAAIAVASLAVAYDESLKRQPAAGSAGQALPAADARAPTLLAAHEGPVIAAASTEDDQWIVSAGADATLRVWDASSGKLEHTIPIPDGPVTAFAVDGRRALVGHSDGVVALWDLMTGKKLASFRYGDGTITSVAFLGDRFVAARQDGDVAWLGEGTPDAPADLLAARNGGGPRIATARARGLLAANGPDRTVRLWRTPGPHLVRTYHLTSDSSAMDLAPDASYIAGGSADGVVRAQRSPALRDFQSDRTQTFKAHDGRVTALALGPSGLLASAGEDGGIRVWTLRPQRLWQALEGGPVQTLSFSRDGRRLLAGGRDGVIRMWTLPLPPAASALGRFG